MLGHVDVIKLCLQPPENIYIYIYLCSYKVRLVLRESKKRLSIINVVYKTKPREETNIYFITAVIKCNFFCTAAN